MSQEFPMMRKYIFLFVVLFLGRNCLAQEEAPAKINLIAAVNKNVYLGNLGNGVLDFGQKFNGGTTLGIDYAWSKSYSIGFRFSRGKLSYEVPSSELESVNFSTRFKSFSIQGIYELNNGILFPDDSKIRVGIAHSIGINEFAPKSSKSQSHLGLNVGLMVRYPVYQNVEAFYQFGTNWTMLTDLEGYQFDSDPQKDLFISHSIGTKYTISLSNDRDGDGILDINDACPNQIGSKEMKGCPDSDLDGISDLEDDCIYDPGPISANGCPDSDGDGILDKRDRCPDTFGPKSTAGCPDTDKDGLLDYEDQCPQIPGLKKFKGCPDTDNDGISDQNDSCPQVFGLKSLDGCPDSDRDGVPDSEDECPLISGPASTAGCPDSDGDGIIDPDDDCPSVYGVASKNGCPDDGFFHLTEVDRLASNIRFSGKSKVLLNSSNKYLSQLYDFLKTNDNYKLMIVGHMDSEGNEELNMIYSLERAGAVKDYLIGRGIEGFRLVSWGLGETEALNEQSDPRARMHNRRIELKVALR